MRIHKHISFFVVLTVCVQLIAGCSGCSNKTKNKPSGLSRGKTLAIDMSLRQRLSEFSIQPRTKGQFAFDVYDLTADKPVYGYNENQAMSSASCLKLLSGVAGLHLLGTDYFYKTSVYVRGDVKGGMLYGDLGFKIGLDPQIMAPDLAQFAKIIKNKGIGKLTGKLLIDLTITEPVRSEEHWYPWDLSFSRYGLFYKGEDRVVQAIKSALRMQGVQVVDSQVVMAVIPRGMRCVYQYKRSIGYVTQRMWKHSSNTQATAMLYTIGHHVNPHADPVLAGVDYLRTFLRDTLNLKDSSLVVHDGCGLCTFNRLSPRSLTSILRFGYLHKPIFQRLYSDLSVSGVDGTLLHSFQGPKTKGKIRAKTGTLSHPYGISSLAGYCQGSNGHLLAFAIMDTEMSVLDARVLQRKLCEALVE